MLKPLNYHIGLNIDSIEICDFESMTSISNEQIMKMSRGDENKRLLNFVSQRIKISNRFWVKEEQDSLVLARQALERLVAQDPSIIKEAEFLIFAGISNPMPTVCTSAFLAEEYKFENASCWDIKSGCSTGVLALQQALNWFQLGAKKGVIVCSETFSKFTNMDILQMSASIGDGACALIVSADESTEVLGCVHGTDSRYIRTMYVPGKYPIDIKTYNKDMYHFHFEQKADAIEKMTYYWKQSLTDLLELSKISGDMVNHYISHQVDGSKNLMIAQNENIKEKCVALNFTDYGNMGCPTIFINYYFWKKNNEIAPGDVTVFHAVGGGLSWAGLCLRKKSD